MNLRGFIERAIRPPVIAHAQTKEDEALDSVFAGPVDGPTLVTREFPDGTLRQTTDGGVTWVIIGGAQPPAPQTPQIEYDPSGRAFYWDFINGQPFKRFDPSLDDPTRAAGYRAPSTAQPPAPQTYTDRNGDIVGIDRSGQEVFRIKGADWASISPQAQERIRQGDLAEARRYQTAERIAGQEYAAGERLAGQAFQAGERAADRTFTTGERLGSEAFTAGENALSRALTAGQFASTLALNNEQNRFTADQAFQQARRAYTQDQLAGAQQVADNISNIDPGALPAFYAAGGGTITNALAGGATAQSDLANIGSARALQAVEMAAPPERFTFNTATFDPRYGYSGAPAGQPVGASPVAQTNAWMPGQDFPGVQAARDIAYAQGSGMTVPEFEAYKASIDAQGKQPNTLPTADVGKFFPGMARGGMTSGMAVVGEDGPELAMAVPGGFAVLNEAQLGIDPMRLREAPRAADGGVFGYNIVQPSDEPYLARIRQIRSGVDTSNPMGIGPFNTGYRTLAPSLQRRQAAAYQTAYGVPEEDFFAEEQRFRVPGTSRGAFALGY